MIGEIILKKRKQLGLAGAPTEGSFDIFKAYLHQECDSKDYAEVVRNYVKRNYSKEEAADILKVPTYEYATSHTAGFCYWQTLNNEFTGRYENALNYLKDKFEELRLKGSQIKVVDKPKSAITPIMRQQYHVYATVLDDLYRIEDKWHVNEEMKYDLYRNCIIHDIKRFDEIEQWINEHLLDYRAVINKEDEQIMEAYAHIKTATIKKRIKQLEGFLSDINNLKQSKRAVRKVSVKKVKTADKQVEKLKYQKENMEFKLTSIIPMRIPGKMNLYTFNTKTRQLTVFISESPDGLMVSGSTIKKFDKTKSVVFKLRKPEDIIPQIMSKTPKQILKLIDSIKAVKKSPTGRINDQTILLRIK